MTYKEARVYLDEMSKYGSVLGLDSIKSLLGELGNPQKDLKFIHIAGTNGKGSILAGLSGILQQAGYRTGRYCSPTVMGYMERFQVDGQWMAEDELAPFVSQVKEAAEKVEEKTDLTVTVFEIETAIAFLYFREKQCDYVVLEAGMGGLLDATNVIDTTVLSIFASISMEHIGVLGNTLEEIAENKAGIIKPSCLAVVTSPQQMSVTDILQKKAGECGCRFVVSHPEKAVISEETMDGQIFSYGEYKDIDKILAALPEMTVYKMNADTLLRLYTESEGLSLKEASNLAEKILMEKLQYAIRKQDTSNGKINIADELTKAKEGQTLTFSVVANDGYEVDSVSAGGENIPVIKWYLFDNSTKGWRCQYLCDFQVN